MIGPILKGHPPRRSRPNDHEGQKGEDHGSQGTAHDHDEPAFVPKGKPTQAGDFYPTLDDVLKTRYLIQHKVVSRTVPTEIVDLIVDDAEYWPSEYAAMYLPSDAKAARIPKDMDKLVVRSVPLCYTEEVRSTLSRFT